MSTISNWTKNKGVLNIMKINHNPNHTTYSIVFFTPPSKKKQKTRQSILFCKLFGGFLDFFTRIHIWSYLHWVIYKKSFTVPYFMQMHLYSVVLRFAKGRAPADLRPFLTLEVGRGLLSIQLCMMYSLLLVTSNYIVSHVYI